MNPYEKNFSDAVGIEMTERAKALLQDPAVVAKVLSQLSEQDISVLKGVLQGRGGNLPDETLARLREALK